MYISVHVYAGAKKERVSETGPNRYEMTVKEPARGNAANWRVRELLAERYSTTTKQIRIISGHHSPRKVLDVPDAD